MERDSSKPPKHSSNISDLVSKFAKVCKLRSIGVFHENQVSSNPNCVSKNGEVVSGESSDATGEIECGVDKVHPQPVEVPIKGNVGGDVEILKLFDTISALKLAYVQLQKAHIPYDPTKIIDANKLVMAELETLSKIKKTCKQRQFTKHKRKSSRLELLRAEIEVIGKTLEKLKGETKAKDLEILNLREQLVELDAENEKFAQVLKQECTRRKTMVWNVDTLEDIFIKASKSIHDFAKPLISLMKASGWDLDLAAKSVQDGVVYSKRCHKKYAFEAYIARRMFQGIVLKSYDVNDVMTFDDPIDSFMQHPNSTFAEFCREKYMLVIHPIMELSSFGNLDQRTLVLSGKHPRTPFYEAFAKMAKLIWVLQGTAVSIDPKAKMFFVKQGSRFSAVCMQSIEEDYGVASRCCEGHDTPNVQFMITPGFKIGEKLLKARVYLHQ